MTVYCTLLLNQATKSDIQAACIQADAALKASYWTAGAGAFAILAAFIGGWLALLAAKRQISANREEQSKQRRHNLKSEVYVAAAKVLATGLGVAVRMANLEIRSQDVLSVYNERTSDMFGVHLVADLETASKFLDCTLHLSKMHLQLIGQRPFRPDGRYGRDEYIEWSRKCSSAISDVVSPMVSAIAAMRMELGTPIDAKLYEKLIRDALEEALAYNARTFSELCARWDAEKMNVKS